MATFAEHLEFIYLLFDIEIIGVNSVKIICPLKGIDEIHVKRTAKLLSNGRINKYSSAIADHILKLYDCCYFSTYFFLTLE